ncbi:MAG TPA: sialidase family protein [Paludibaculum sp.]|jgi:sialidase-1
MHCPQALLLCLLLPSLPAAEFTQTDLFQSGEGGYHTYRIPALVVTTKGTLLAFCEGRRGGGADSGDIDILLRRSLDHGRTWSPPQVVADLGDDTIGNPVPVVDRKTGAISLLLTRNPGKDTERQIIDGTASGTRTVWLSRSTDDGATWTPPAEITASVKLPNWTWYATGPGNGIQLRDGRLVVPCDHIVAVTNAYYSHVIVSDDGGRTWKLGGSAGDKTNESAVVELRDGSLLLNMRSYNQQNRRALATSRDRGATWSSITYDDALIDPICQASLIRFRKDSLLFSNPADTKRVRMTVKLSRDEGKTWPVARLVHDGPAAYSSLAQLEDGRIGLLYERGEKRAYELITFARFDQRWLAGKQ